MRIFLTTQERDENGVRRDGMGQGDGKGLGVRTWNEVRRHGKGYGMRKGDGKGLRMRQEEVGEGLNEARRDEKGYGMRQGDGKGLE